MPPSRSLTPASASRVDSTMPVGCAIDSTRPSSMAQKKDRDPSGCTFWIERQ